MKLLFIASGLLFSVSALADDSDALKRKLAGLQSFDAAFTQQVITEDGTELQQSEGQLSLKRPGKIRWQQTTPDETLFVSNGVTSYYFDSFAEQVTVMDSQSLVDSTPFVLLTSNDPDIWNKYRVLKTDAGFEMVPGIDTQSQVAKLKVRFAEDNLAALVVVDVSGQQSHFAFKDAHKNIAIQDTRFEFSIPADVAVDDQRQRD